MRLLDRFVNAALFEHLLEEPLDVRREEDKRPENREQPFGLQEMERPLNRDPAAVVDSVLGANAVEEVPPHECFTQRGRRASQQLLEVPGGNREITHNCGDAVFRYERQAPLGFARESALIVRHEAEVLTESSSVPDESVKLQQLGPLHDDREVRVPISPLVSEVAKELPCVIGQAKAETRERANGLVQLDQVVASLPLHRTPIEEKDGLEVLLDSLQCRPGT